MVVDQIIKMLGIVSILFGKFIHFLSFVEIDLMAKFDNFIG